MGTSFRLEYIILIVLCLSYYFYVKKDENRKKDNKNFINKNLTIGSKIINNSGIIGEVIDMDDLSCLILTGDIDRVSYIKITKDSIEKIIEA